MAIFAVAWRSAGLARQSCAGYACIKEFQSTGAHTIVPDVRTAVLRIVAPIARVCEVHIYNHIWNKVLHLH